MEMQQTLILLLIICPESYGRKNTMKNLSEAVFKDNSPEIRPYCPGSTRVNVTMDLAIHQLIDMDEPEQIIQINLWIRLKWTDCLLYWEPSEYENITNIVVPFDKIWTPDLSLYDGVSTEFYGLEDYRPNLYYNGTVLYNFPSVMEVQCPVDVTNFPFDSQMCPLMFGSWTYNGHEVDIDLKNNYADLSALKDNVEWIIDKVPASKHINFYTCCSEPYPDVRYFVYLTRKPRYYQTNIIFPSMIITLLASLGYVLPVDSGEKVSLEVTIVLSLIVFQLLVADRLPPSAEARPWIGDFFSFTLLLCGLSTLIQVIVINIYWRGDRRMPKWMKQYILKPMSIVTLTKAHWNLGHGKDHADSEDESVEVDDLDNTTLWQTFAICIDRVGLILFLTSLTIGCIYIFANF